METVDNVHFSVWLWKQAKLLVHLNRAEKLNLFLGILCDKFSRGCWSHRIPDLTVSKTTQSSSSTSACVSAPIIYQPPCTCVNVRLRFCSAFTRKRTKYDIPLLIRLNIYYLLAIFCEIRKFIESAKSKFLYFPLFEFSPNFCTTKNVADVQRLP